MNGFIEIFRTCLKIILFIGSLMMLMMIGLSALHEDYSRFEDRVAQPDAINSGDVSVRFMGNTNLLFSDGQTSVLVDGWFSRPSLLSLIFTKIEPDLSAIDSAFERGQIGQVAAVIPVHSHYDHAMDSPEVARRTGAQLLGSNSTANIARGWGLDQTQIEVVQPNQPYYYGSFVVTLIPSAHFEFPKSTMSDAFLSDIEITEPLETPAKVGDYKMGGAYTIHIQHPKGSVIVQGSAGFIPNTLDGIDVDVAFIGIGGLSGQSEDYRKAYWQHTVSAIKPKMIYPIHWDSLIDPIGDKPVMPNLLLSKAFNFSAVESLEHTFAYAEKSNINISVLPMWQPVRLFKAPN